MADDSVSVCALRSDVRRSQSSDMSPILRLLGVPPLSPSANSLRFAGGAPGGDFDGIENRDDKERPILFAEFFFFVQHAHGYKTLPQIFAEGLGYGCYISQKLTP